MEPLTHIRVVKELMEKYGLRFSKGLGQNFIINPSICPKIAAMGGAGAQVGAIEIGPGVGVLTAELAKTCKKVVSVEVDDRLLPLLRETLAEYPQVSVLRADIMQVDLHELIAREFQGMEVVVCANLPYYITSPILMKLLEERLPIRSVTVMVQKEAAERLCAPLPSRQAGAITVAIRYFSVPRLLFGVSRGSFLPSPEVDSAVIRLDILQKPPVRVPDEGFFFRVVKAAFAQRRKTLLNTLSSGLSMDKAAVSAALSAAGVNPGARAEQLSLEELAAAAGALYRD